MAIKEVFFFIACFSILYGLGDSIDIRCEYETWSYTAIGPAYECTLNNTLNITSRESAVINSVNGSHKSGKSNPDVTSFYSDKTDDVIDTINYFPRNLGNIFTNLKMIVIRYGHLKEIQQGDLMLFTKLVRLGLDNNDIEFLEDGLFAYNPKLEYIDFGSNKIVHIGSQVFETLNHLTWLYLHYNTCIDINAENNQTAVREVISQVKNTCQSNPDKHTINLIGNEIDIKNDDDSNAFEIIQQITDLNDGMISIKNELTSEIPEH